MKELMHRRFTADDLGRILFKHMCIEQGVLWRKPAVLNLNLHWDTADEENPFLEVTVESEKQEGDE